MKPGGPENGRWQPEWQPSLIPRAHSIAENAAESKAGRTWGTAARRTRPVAIALALTAPGTSPYLSLSSPAANAATAGFRALGANSAAADIGYFAATRDGRLARSARVGVEHRVLRIAQFTPLGLRHPMRRHDASPPCCSVPAFTHSKHTQRSDLPQCAAPCAVRPPPNRAAKTWRSGGGEFGSRIPPSSPRSHTATPHTHNAPP
jgi:hypothetical protein